MFGKKPLLALVLVTGLMLPACGGEDKPAPPEARPAAEQAAQPVPSADEPEAAQEGGAAEPDQGPENMATVNGVPISRRVFDSQLALLAAEREALGLGASQSGADMLRLEVLRAVINLELACQEALRRGYAPSDEDIEAAWDEMKKSYQDKEEGLANDLAIFGGGEEEFRAALVKDLAMRKWREYDFLDQVAVTDEEARAYYDARRLAIAAHGEMRRASEIFLSVPLVATEEVKNKVRQKAEQIHQRLEHGDNFGALALEFSNSPDVDKNFGDMGWLEKGQLLPPLEKALFELEPGQTSGLIEGPTGFHIFRLTAVRPAGFKSYHEMKVPIMDFLSEEKLQAALGRKLAALYDQAEIEIIDPGLKKAFDDYKAGLNEAPAGNHKN